MSDVNLVFSVNTVSSTFLVDTTTVNVTPNTTAINMFAGYAAYPPNGAAGNSQVLFNDAGLFSGNANFTYNKTSSKLTIANLQVDTVANLGVASNLRISGGSAGQYLTSNGAGGLSFTTLSPGGSNTQLLYNNNGSFGGIPNVTFSGGNISLGNISNVKITGGTNGYVLQTDGTGNLTWTAQTGGGSGNGAPGGSNTQIQYNDAGTFGGDSGFTYDSVLDTMSVNTAAIGNVKTDNLVYANGSPYSFVTPPAGSNTYIQFNNAGAFGAVSNFTFNTSTSSLNVPNITVGSNAVMGNLTVNNSISCTEITSSTGNIGILNVSDVATFTDSIVIQQAKEKVTLNGTGASGSINFDIMNQSIVLQTANATADFTLNLRGNSSTSFNDLISTGQSITFTYINKNGSTAYILSNLRIDGIIVFPVYPLVPLSDGTVDGYDMYMFNVVKTDVSTYVVFGSYGNYQ